MNNFAITATTPSNNVFLSGKTLAEMYPELAGVRKVPARPAQRPVITETQRKHMEAQSTLRNARAAYKAAREALGASNMMGTTLNRGECMANLNRARKALSVAMADAEKLLGRAVRPRKKTGKK